MTITPQPTAIWNNFPTEPIKHLGIAWQEVLPFYQELSARTLDTNTLEGWMADWSKLQDLLSEISTRLSIAKDQDTANEAAEKRYLEYQEGVVMPAEACDQELRTKLLNSNLEPKNFSLPLIRMRIEAELFREPNLALEVEEDELSMEYARTIGAQTVLWRGKETTIPSMESALSDPDRAVREEAWTLCKARQDEDYETLGTVWKNIFKLRLKIAQNADLPTYRDYTWKAYARLDYTPKACEEFCAAIHSVVVPAAARVYERRRKALNVSVLRPWDLMNGWYSRPVDPPGISKLSPASDAAALAAGTRKILGRLHPKFEQDFGLLEASQLLDLDNRKDKAPGGYCTYLDVIKRPFIFMNAVGNHDGVQTLLHEFGHALHSIESSALNHPGQREVPIEFCEVASMSMELLANQFMEQRYGGFYSSQDAARARLEHLENSLLFWPFMAVVDSFQQWAYTHTDRASEPDQCSAQWLELWRRFLPSIDYSGYEEHCARGWQRKGHIYSVPFYYVEYGIAQLGALQIFRRSKTAHQQALHDYLAALALGGTVPLPQLFSAAGAEFRFDPEMLREVVGFVEQEIAELY